MRILYSYDAKARIEKALAAFHRILTKANKKIAEGPARGLFFDSGLTTSQAFLLGNYERPVQEALFSILSKDAVFYDIGANIGFFSILAAKTVGPGGSVYAFEPLSENASMIEKNANRNKLINIYVERVAVADKTGKREIILTECAGGATLKTAGNPPDPIGSQVVETVALDELAQSGRIKMPDVVKIDVEGAELDVLSGMAAILNKKAPSLIIEFDDVALISCKKKLSAAQELLEGIGYQTKILSNSYNDGSWFVRHLMAQKMPR